MFFKQRASPRPPSSPLTHVGAAQVAALSEIFPTLDREVLASILQASDGRISLAVDMALALCSDDDQGEAKTQKKAENISDTEEQELQEALAAAPSFDVSFSPPAPPPPLVWSDQGATLGSGNGNSNLQLLDAIRSPHTPPAASVMARSEMTLLQLLRRPRRGAPVVLPDDFLRVPGHREKKVTVPEKKMQEVLAPSPNHSAPAAGSEDEYRVTLRRGPGGGSLGLSLANVDGHFQVCALPRHGQARGLAESAGVTLGDEVIGVMDISFQRDPWALPQLVQYVKEVEGPVLLHMKRGSPAAAAPPHGLVTAIAEEGLSGSGPKELEEVEGIRRQIEARGKQWDQGFLTPSQGSISTTLPSSPTIKGLGPLSPRWRWSPATSACPVVSPPKTGRRSLSVSLSPKRPARSGRASTGSRSLGGAYAETGPLWAVSTKGLREALCVRVVGVKDDGDHLLYKVRAGDVVSGGEWVVEKRYSQFYELHESLLKLCRASMAKLYFPSRGLPLVIPAMQSIRDREANSRRMSLDAYVRALADLLYLEPLQPNSAKVVQAFQRFLEADERTENLVALQVSRPKRMLRQQLSLMCWRALRLPPLAASIDGFVGRVFAEKSRMTGDQLLEKTKLQIELTHKVLCKGCWEDLAQAARGGQLGSLPAGAGEGAEKEHALDEELAVLIDSAIRRQVEAEVWPAVSDVVLETVSRELEEESLACSDMEKVIAWAETKPQTFFGIKVEQISASSWASAVEAMQQMGALTLLCDKLEALVTVAHQINVVYAHEHREPTRSLLGADDLFPIFLWVLVQACKDEGGRNTGIRGKDLPGLVKVLSYLCDPTKVLSEIGYYLATLEAAIAHLRFAFAEEGQQT